MGRESDGGRPKPRSKGGSGKPRGRRGGAGRRKSVRAGKSEGPRSFEPDREQRTDILQQQLEGGYEGPSDYGDPLDPEGASEEDIAAEFSNRRDENDSVSQQPSSVQGGSEAEAEPDVDGPGGDELFPLAFEGGEAGEEPLPPTLSEEGEPVETSPLSSGNESYLEPSPGDASEVGFPADRTPDEGDLGSARSENKPAARTGRSGDRLSILWDHIRNDSAFPIQKLERQEGEKRRWERYIYALGVLRDNKPAAIVASPSVDSNMLVYGLRFLSELLKKGERTTNLILCAPFFTDELRKTAYLVDPKKTKLKLIKLALIPSLDGGYREVDTLRPETRDVNRSFEDLLSEITTPNVRKLLARFKEVTEGAIVEKGGDGAICRGRKIFFRMRGEDLLVARPRDNGIHLEILYPRTKTLRLTEKNLDQTLSRIRECFEAASKSPGLSNREGGFRLAVREALEENGVDLTPVDTDVSVGANRLRLDVLAARSDGTPVAVQIRTRLTLEDIQRGFAAVAALREQSALLKKSLGRAGIKLNSFRDPELIFISLRPLPGVDGITDLVVPRVSFLRVKPERRWWESALSFEGNNATARTATVATTTSEVKEAVQRPTRPRPERAALRIEGKNPAVIVSHYDRDGIIANLVLARIVPQVAVQRFMSSEDLIGFFFKPEVQASLPEVYDLYLTDLRFRTAKRLSPEAKSAFIEELRKLKGNIYWLDHVYWQDVDRKDIETVIGKANLVIIPRERTAAQVIMRAIKINDEFSSKLVDLLYGRLGEGEYNDWGKNWLSVIDYLRNDLSKIESAIKPLLDARPGDLNQELLEEGKRKEEEAEAYVASRDFRVVIFGSYKMAIVDLKDKQSMNYTSVTQKVRDRYKAQLSITVFGDADTIIIANSFSERRGMNMTVLKEHLTARFEWLATVQGHENVITLDIEDLPLHRERLDIIINEIVRNRSIFT